MLHQKGTWLRRSKVALSVAAVLLLTTACGGQPSDQAKPAAGDAKSEATAKVIKIGAIYPLSGDSAGVGADAKAAIELAQKIINEKTDLNIILAKEAGLPNLGGAKIQVVFADSQSKPDIGATEAERLITQEKVVALMGSYNSAVTQTTSQVAERSGIPYLNPDSALPSLTTRGFKFFFRSTPYSDHFSTDFTNFIKDLASQGQVKSGANVAIFSNDSPPAQESVPVVAQKVKAAGFNIVTQIKYPTNTPNVSNVVQQIAAAKADIVWTVGTEPEAVLVVQGLKNAGMKVPVFFGDSYGYEDPSFIPAVGSLAENMFVRSRFSVTATDDVKKVNALFKQQTTHDLTGDTGSSLNGLFILADAINRAKSTDPGAIRDALLATDLKVNDTLVPYAIKFDPTTHQNVLAHAIITQIQGGKYIPVYPAENANAKPILGWPK